MSKSDSSLVRSLTRTFVALSLLLTGCSDVITYSADSQKQGESLYHQGDYANAAGAFRNSVRQNPRNYVAQYELGVCYQQLDQPQLAIAAYRTALQTINLTLEGQYDHATHENILYGLSNVIAKSDTRNVEVDAIQRDAEAHKDADLWFVLARIYSQRGDADSAIDAYNHATLLEPKNFMIAKSYALYLVKIGQTQRAETALRKAYKLNDQDEQIASALRSMGIVPGPSILDQSQLAQPILPKGPIPDRSTRNEGASITAPRD